MGLLGLTILGPVILVLLGLLPWGLILIQQGIMPGDIDKLSMGLLLLSLGGPTWLWVGLWLKRALTTTQIWLMQDQVHLHHQLWGWTYRRREWSAAAIQTIDCLPLEADHFALSMTLTNQQVHRLADQLSGDESQRLERWLRDGLSHCAIPD